MASTPVDDDEYIVEPPAHPIPQLQGPFDESMVESINELSEHESNLDSVARRTMLLEMPEYERVIGRKWRQKPGEKYHPLWKITAQMSFGIHLLAEGMARSEAEVLAILQSHVDDIDGFLERSTEDFDLAQSDVEERLSYLKLPLQHVEVFDRMLEDRAFRMSIVDGNEKIEHIVDRTSEAMKDSLKDVHKGLEAMKALEKYLADLEDTWIRYTDEHEAVFMAMLGNVEGWSRALLDLYSQGNKLGKCLVQLSEIVAEMQRRAGVVSRRTLIRPPSAMPPLRQSFQPAQSRYSHRQEGVQTASRPTSASRTATPKPLPVAPDIHSSTRNSSRPRLPRQSSSAEKQPTFGERSSSSAPTRKLGSDNTSSTPTPLESRSSGPDPATIQHPNISELAAIDYVPRKQAARPIQPRVKNITPMELPAEVPKRALSQAPHSSKSRLNKALGLKNRDHDAEKRSSQFITAKSLGSLLKSPQPSRPPPTPRALDSKDTTGSEAKLSTKPTDISKDQHASPVASNAESTVVQSAVLAPRAPQINEGLGIHGLTSNSESAQRPNVSSQRRPHNPTFTSHPPEMMLGAKPILSETGLVKPADLSSEVSGPTSDKSAHSRQKSLLSSLGEPGPEIEVGGSASHPPETATKLQPSTLLDAIARRTLLSSEKPHLSQPKAPATSAASSNTRHLDPSPYEHDNTTSTAFIAEMEGSSPAILAPLTFGPVELEAPQQRLILPPRPKTLMTAAADLPSATINSQSDFFKLPTLQSAQGPHSFALMTSEALSAKGHALLTLPSINAAGDERSSLPSRLSGLRVPRKQPAGLSRNNCDLMEQISHTPQESPIHTRTLSEASSSSARIAVERPSRSLAPPHEAPPPPGPGGRAMVNPDYAAAGAFEGERRSKHGSTGSVSSWKKLLPGATTSLSPAGSRPGSSSVSADAKSSGVNMMTAGGKDVLWFKGMSRDGVWVSSS